MTRRTRKKEKVSRLTKELLETARDMRNSGLMTKANHDKITMRHLADSGVAKAVGVTPRVES